MITIYPNRTFVRNTKQTRFFENLSKMTGSEIFPFSCGRAALVYGLRALGLQRMDEILVPPYLGHCVLSALARASFPTMTASSRTKALLVFHQFGYPQKIEEIHRLASEKEWIIVNDCANTIFSSLRKEMIIKWGDFSVLSFSKIYPCILGGALISNRGEIRNWLNENYKKLSLDHLNRANMAYDTLEKSKKGLLGYEAGFEVDAVFGYLPEVVSFPSRTLASLPDGVDEIEKDIARRKRLLNIVRDSLSGRVPDCPGEDVVPFAIPVSGEESRLDEISARITVELNMDVPVLYFDFARNMLNPDYRKALVIGCHEDWNEDIVKRICDIIREYGG